MRKLTILVATALMLATILALSGVAQTAPVGGKADAKCLAEANKTLQPGFKPSDYNFVGGTEGIDRRDTLTATDGPDVFCGFGGDDAIDGLDRGDIFLGGAGNDCVSNSNYGTFYGGEGFGYNYPGGTFYGEGGDDDVFSDQGGTFVQ